VKRSHVKKARRTTAGGPSKTNSPFNKNNSWEHREETLGGKGRTHQVGQGRIRPDQEKIEGRKARSRERNHRELQLGGLKKGRKCIADKLGVG